MSKKDEKGKFPSDKYDLTKMFTTQSDNKRVSSRSTFLFKDGLIEKLPYITSGYPRDLYDSDINEQDHGGKLVLRVGKTTKTFYPYINRKMGRKLGTWVKRKDSNHYLENEAIVRIAKERFHQYVKDNAILDQKNKTVGDMTIKEYVKTLYKKDRQTTGLKNKQSKPVREQTIRSILSAFDPWIHFKLRDVNKNWPEKFKEHWGTTPSINAQNNTEKLISTDTMRKNYTMLNAMFNVCERKGYIASNRMDGNTNLFPRNKNTKIDTYSMDYDDLIKFIFRGDTPGNIMGKIIVATMILTGARNAEIFKNFRSNWFLDEEKIFIPANISKNEIDRDVFPHSKKYWQKIRQYIDLIYTPNAFEHMFPSPVISKSGHVSDSIYKPVWQAIKVKYGLKRMARLYTFRASFATRMAKNNGIEVTAKALGDTVETTAKYYTHIDDDALKQGSKDVFNNNKTVTQGEATSPLINNTSEIHELNIVQADRDKIPKSILEEFDIFINGKTLPSQNQMLKNDWMAFVKFAKEHIKENNINDKKTTTWLKIQSI
ncbi:hypothetical protein A9Q74_13075 [Colwellia sp. 39_35_sub15_T18]|nr:hypothetical protein A9Q74_13075 [Colwellia sp. 39_35_sub15_T18]